MSTQQSYRALLEEFCLQSQIVPSFDDASDGECHLVVNQIVFTLCSGGEPDPDGLLIFCEFGEAPTDCRALAHARLMEANLLWFRRNGPTFSLHPETERVILSARASLSKTSPTLLRETLSVFSTYAHLWRKHFLLEDEERRSGAVSVEAPKGGIETMAAKRGGAMVSVEAFQNIAVRFLDADEAPMNGAALTAWTKKAQTTGASGLSPALKRSLDALTQEGLIRVAV